MWRAACGLILLLWPLTISADADPWHFATIQAPAAWAATRGDASVIIAIVDSGIDHGHGEFAGRILAGYDFIDDDDSPQDAHGHGTSVASIAAGATAGICPRCSILPVRVLNENESGSAADLAAGIRYAADHRADIINLSVVLNRDVPEVATAVDYARSTGAILIGCAGNTGGQVIYPAAYSGVLAISATTRSDELWAESNRGTVDLAAPGQSIYSARMGGGYGSFTGTSAAAAQVSGLAGMLLTLGVNGSDLASVIEASTVDLGESGYDPLYGHGRIDAWSAVRPFAKFLWFPKIFN